ncbi:hypothetical protein [Rheinheimera sp. NSM]|uniref:hypothetical protein n=1 Tax=Rheinheimera sp. NSM TaxID=3457884 RepID=UPI00403509E9
MAAKVSLNNSAFFSLLLEGLEAYAIKHHGKKSVAIETHAQLWGKVNKRLPFSCEVKHISVDSSAKKSRGSVTPDLLSLELKRDVANMFGDEYRHLGTFHTHPWIISEELYEDERVESPNSIRRHKLYEFSNSDHFCECGRPTIEVGKNKFSVALVMTILAASKADDRKDGAINDDLFEFSLGNVKVWLKAQIYQHKELDKLSGLEWIALNKYQLLAHKKFKNNDFKIVPVPIETKLETPFLENMDYFLEKFGRLRIDSSDNVDSYYIAADNGEKRWLFM